jgi:hypothetical protein
VTMKDSNKKKSDSQPSAPQSSGSNRTGSARSPDDARAVVEGAGAGVPAASLDASELARARSAEARAAQPVGQPPQAGRADGADGLDAEEVARMQTEQGTLLLDFIGERLALERTGVRLYEALLAKLDAAERYPGRPARAEVALLRDQMLAHFHLLTNAVERLGGDPTAVTPAADVMGNVANGLVQAITDPRTTFPQGLRLLVAGELIAKDAWEMLVDITERVGLPDLAQQFQRAADEDEEHLAAVRTWLRRAFESLGAFDRDAPADQPAEAPAAP